MKLNKINFDNHKYVSCKKHEELDLYLYNYTPECQYERIWDDVTIQSRGLVLDFEGNTVSCCLPKFFNYNEIEQTKIENLPKENPNVTIKEDGSYISVSNYKDNLIVASRGSFESEQAKWSYNWIEDNYELEDFKKWVKGKTLILECIYPENRIVIDYGKYEGLKLITIFDNDQYKEWSYKDMVRFAKDKALDFVFEKKFYHIREILNSVESLGNNEEGYVLRYSNGLRVKIKGEQYKELHKIITGISTTSIWEFMSKGMDVEDVITKVPDEFFDWANKVYEELGLKYKEIEDICKNIFEQVKDLSTRKEQAEFILGKQKSYSGIIFNMLDNKAYDKLIWDRIKPEFEKPFSG